MSFTYRDLIDAESGDTVRHIIEPLPDGGVRTFPYVDGNPNKERVDEWIAEDNTLEAAT